MPRKKMFAGNRKRPAFAGLYSCPPIGVEVGEELGDYGAGEKATGARRAAFPTRSVFGQDFLRPDRHPLRHLADWVKHGQDWSGAALQARLIAASRRRSCSTKLFGGRLISRDRAARHFLNGKPALIEAPGLQSKNTVNAAKSVRVHQQFGGEGASV